MSDDYDSDLNIDESGLDSSLNDASFDIAAADTSFDVDSVLNESGDDFSQFDIPTQTEESNIVNELEDGAISPPIEGDFDQDDLGDNGDLQTDDQSFDVNSIMEAGSDDFEQFNTPDVDAAIATTDELNIEDSVEGSQQEVETDFEVTNEGLVGSQEQTNALADIPFEDENIESALPTVMEENETGEISHDIEINGDVEPTADVIPQNNQDGWGDVQPDLDQDKRPIDIEEIKHDSDDSVTNNVEIDQAVADFSTSEIQSDSLENHQDLIQNPEPISDNFCEPTNIPSENLDQISVTDTIMQPDNKDISEEVSVLESNTENQDPLNPDKVPETIANVPEMQGHNLDEGGDTPVNQIPETGETNEETSEPLPGVSEVVEEKPIREYDNFEQSVKVEKPEFYESGLFFEQGINEYGYQGTCGPTSQANAINKVLGTNEFTENKILSIAVDNQICATNGFPEECGATTTEQMMELYNIVNAQTGGKIETKLFEYDNALNLDETAALLDEGSVINVAVDSYRLWDQQRDYSDPIGSYTQDFASDHWITVTGARRDEQGNIAGFEIVDSGGGKNYVPAQQYQEMCFGTEDHKVIDPTSIVITKKDMEKDVSQYQPDTSHLAQPNWFQRIFKPKGGN